MPFNLVGWLFHSKSFCYCIPVRAGFVLMSVLTFLLSGAISIIIWFEIFHSYEFSTKERVAFILAGIVESILFLVSTIGFIGVVARKQLFVIIYTYFLYVHFVINIIVGVYLLVIVRESNRQQLVNYCAEVLVNTSMESSCSKLMSVSTYVFIAIVATLLLLEFYGVLIATRYVYRLRKQKRDDRSRRLGYYHALSKPETPGRKHTRQESDNIELLHAQENSADPRELEDGVVDVGRRTYMPVSTHDDDSPPAPALSPRDGLSDTASSRRVRALPPRPAGSRPPSPPAVPHTADGTHERAVPGVLPNPHERLQHGSKGREPQTPDSEDRRSLYTAEVSSTTHSALMDHASYMRSTFNTPPPVPSLPHRSVR